MHALSKGIASTVLLCANPVSLNPIDSFPAACDLHASLSAQYSYPSLILFRQSCEKPKPCWYRSLVRGWFQSLTSNRSPTAFWCQTRCCLARSPAVRHQPDDGKALRTLSDPANLRCPLIIISSNDLTKLLSSRPASFSYHSRSLTDLSTYDHHLDDSSFEVSVNLAERLIISSKHSVASALVVASGRSLAKATATLY